MEKIFTVQTTELIRTSQSWDGVDLPDYLVGKPEIVGIKYEIPAVVSASFEMSRVF